LEAEEHIALGRVEARRAHVRLVRFLCTDNHLGQLLEDLPSRSFPDVAVLIVVRPNDIALFESLQGLFPGVPDVKVIVDRRTDDRRSAQDPVSDDRRRVSTRQLRQGRTVGGCTVVRFTPRVPPYV
jgi:hypothetical protein